MNLLWAWQCGFLRRRLEYKYGLLRLELLFSLWYKGFQKTEQIGQVATWAVPLCFCQKRCGFCTSAPFSKTRCRFSHLHKHRDRGRRGKKKILGDYFSLWNRFLWFISSLHFWERWWAVMSAACPPVLKWPDLTPAHLTVFAGHYYLLWGLWFCGLKDERYMVQQGLSKLMRFFTRRCQNKWATMHGHWWGRLSVSGWQGFKVPAREA